jgi:hypothetical protein
LSDTPVFILVRDRLRGLRKLVAWLERAGQENLFLLDNASTYPPLLEYLRTCPHNVVRLGENLGSRALWAAGMVPDDTPFVVTDPDILPIDECPLDAVAHLGRLLDRHSSYSKVGLGLYLDDVPASMPSLGWERQLVSVSREIPPGGVFDSLIDTTFALYRPGASFEYEAIRTGAPYLARHCSPAWYGGELSDEDRFYLEHATAGPLGSSWKERLAGEGQATEDASDIG